ncbi:ribonuclease Z [Flavobacterium cyanobacteriorum]|uniref:Ribonuclease Z n=1 Tax=Flavobacterium cyanobacteriorum TaxID=2022802 RepID=A0A255ZBJ7_9FLAO|nr:ribonuclease Z [Flavobacterium cyanobacteriorum]OYQ38284.1 ribonuclease Z [Flavobacterium cyanobacteriorum]
MKVQEKGHTTIIKDTKGDFTRFAEAITSEYKKFKNTNLILDISLDRNLTINHILNLLALSNTHRKAKKSFVVVIEDFDFNEVPDEMVVVPTLQEAHDIIEMEEIERDLGF